ncbi:MAG TPA: glycine cleavage system aminomethyltransferase GcvT [Bacilli bacterium]|nr:glycine cleavage system aminomethyltransferase GcvT [Bacilli bacterium]
MKKTILYDEHVRLGGKMVEFAGYLLPIEYTGIALEHQAVRDQCGVFDVSHMGEIEISGKDAIAFINYLFTNDVASVEAKRMVYGLMLYPHGGVVDDMMVYKYNNHHLLLVVNAGNKDKDLAWILDHQQAYDVEVVDRSGYYSQLALQGPKAEGILQSLTKYPLHNLRSLTFDHLTMLNHDFLVSRSGYTGADGFEIYGANAHIFELFQLFSRLPEITLCGLGCRDTLRFEASMPLYGHEIDETINPLEAGLNFAVKLDKSFIGSEVLVAAQASGLKRKVVALELIERVIARLGYEVEADGQLIGHVTTGYMIPNTTKSYAFALIASEYAALGTIVGIRIRKNLVKAKVRNKRLLEKKYVR